MAGLEELKNLTEEERQEALKILEEISKSGSFKSYNNLMNADYKEVPVDIITFITDRKYLGNAWHSSDGKLKLYPFWQEKLKELFPDPYTTKFNNFIESGARGLGKSEIAITCLLYLMYRLMCLKDPHGFLSLKPTEKVAFAFMNITKTLSEEIGVTKFQNTVQMSPWFMSRGTMTQRDNEPYWNPPSFINIIIGSQSSHVIGQPIYGALFDEISFIRNQDIEKQKSIAIDMIDTALGGMQTRFIHNGKNPTLMILASSKRSDKSFLEEHMKKKLSDEDSSVLIVDEAVWNVKPAETYSGETFRVGVGNRFLSSEIIPSEDETSLWINKGYKVIDVPIEFISNFRDNIDRALCDYAGISSSDLTKYISGARLSEIKRADYKNAFVKDIIEVGNAPNDNAQYSDFFDLERIDKNLKSRPLFIHLDMSISGDKTGIAGVWILGKRHSSNNESSSRELYFKLAFSVSVKAPKGYQVSFAKNREFIYWLKEQGFSIRGVSTDTFQNASLAQELLSKGYPYEIVSVDRVNTQSHICEPYAYFKNVIYEKRIQIYDSLLLTQEILGLERNGATGKIDHPDHGRSGSKDMSDAVCGATWNASKHADEFAFEFGEDIENLVSASSSDNIELHKQQITLDFEEELKKIHLPNSNIIKENSDSAFLDFGMGSAQVLTPYYISQGILI